MVSVYEALGYCDGLCVSVGQIYINVVSVNEALGYSDAASVSV